MAALLYWIALDYTGVPNEVSSERTNMSYICMKYIFNLAKEDLLNNYQHKLKLHN